MSDKQTRSELEYERDWCRSKIKSLIAERDRLREDMHEIYSMSCLAMSSDDDLYLYSVNRDIRDIALKHSPGKAALSEEGDKIPEES